MDLRTFFLVALISVGMTVQAQEAPPRPSKEAPPRPPKEAPKREADQTDKAEKAEAAARARAQVQAQILVQKLAMTRAMHRVRETVDRDDPRERIAILAPGGPLIVDLTLTANGQPYRRAREALIDVMLTSADRDLDGRITWEEAMDTPRFTLGRVYALDKQAVAHYIEAHDTNKNQLVERGEARHFVAALFGGPAFRMFSGRPNTIMVFPDGRPRARVTRADLRQLLDTDKNGKLTQDEVQAAAALLQSRDADGNDLLLPEEVNADPTQTRTATVIRPEPAMAVLLGPTLKQDDFYSTLKKRYPVGSELTAESFPRAPKLFAALDQNQNGQIDEDEVLGINQVEPHIEITVDVGDPTTAKGLAVNSVPEGSQQQTTKNGAEVHLPGSHLTFDASLSKFRVTNFQRMADSYMTRLDTDKNGHLDKKELGTRYERMGKMWDLDQDGKIFPKEIAEIYGLQRSPQQSQVRATVTNQGDALFGALDVSNDGRLSLREMKTCAQQLVEFDKDGDGEITPDEIPITLQVVFSLATSASTTIRRPGTNATPTDTAGTVPEWFKRMDRNGDGDLTLKEFLGEESSFAKIDKNEDGFIELAEAQSATDSQ